MSSLNKVTLIGRLGGDPEVRSTSNGDQVVNVTLATSETWKDKHSGEKKEKTEWHRIVVWNQHLGQILMKYAGKGDQVYIEGKLATRKWEKDGIDRYTTEVELGRYDGTVVLLGGKGSQGDANGSPGGSQGQEPGFGGGDLDDEIPF